MIAIGLCLMGGCFAQEGGMAVETYWPAEVAEFSAEISVSSVRIYLISFSDGDSENDEAYIKGRFATHPNASNWTIATGINRPDTLQNGRFNVIAATNPVSINADYANGRSRIKFSYEEVEIEMKAQNGSAFVSVDGAAYATVHGTYTIGPDLSRSFLVRSLTTKALNFFHYRNLRTGVHFNVSALQSPSGAAALFSDFDNSLIEI